MAHLVVTEKPTGGKKLVEADLDASIANVVITDVDCDSSVYVGAVVIMDVNGTAFNALADDISTSNMIGVCESKTSSILCSIRVLGTSGEIFTNLDPTKNYYLSDTVPGGITTTVPTTTGHVKIQIGQPFSSTRMLVLKGSLLVRG